MKKGDLEDLKNVKDELYDVINKFDSIIRRIEQGG